MSFRTILEINHDFTHMIQRDPIGFTQAMVDHCRSGGRPEYVEMLRLRYGVTVVETVHHSTAVGGDHGEGEGAVSVLFRPQRGSIDHGPETVHLRVRTRRRLRDGRVRFFLEPASGAIQPSSAPASGKI